MRALLRSGPFISGAAVLALSAVGIASVRPAGTPAPVCGLTQRQAAFPQPLPANGTWAFNHGLPDGWSVSRCARLTPWPGNGRLITGGTNRAYQLTGPLMSLAPSNYVLHVSLTIVHGGIAANVLDTGRQMFLTDAPNSIFQSTGGTQIRLPFSVSHLVRAQVILSDARTGNAPSVWILQKIRIEKPQAIPASRRSHRSRRAGH